MATLNEFLTSIADAIREKKGTTEPINAQNFASEIGSIETGGGAVVGEIVLTGFEPVDVLPEATEENYDKKKVYFYNDNLVFLVKNANETPSIQSYTTTISIKDYACAAVGNYIYIFGGKSGSTYQSKIYKLNIETKEVQTLSSVLPSVCSTPAAAAVGTDIYIFGGQKASSTYSNAIYKFDTTTETITTLSATLPSSLNGIANVSYGSIIYLFGGYGSSQSNAIYKFDTTTETITTLSATLPSTAYNIPLTLTNGLIYIFGGRGENPSASVCVFNPTDETIYEEVETTLPVTQWNKAAVFSKKDDIFLLGGLAATTGGSTIYHYNTQTKQFTLLPISLKTNFSGMSWTTIGTNVYMLASSTLQIASFSEYITYATIQTTE